MDEMTSEARLCDDKASKAMVDAARLADELRAEQEEALNLERNRTLHEAQVKDMQTKLDEADMNALKGGKKAMNKLESRIDQLQSKIKCYKKQIEEAEEIAALNLAKYRKVQSILSDAEAHADLNEQALGKAKRGASLGPA